VRSSDSRAALYPRSRVTELVVATPVFLDLTFVGLEALPALGEERFAGELFRTPGGGAITAVAAARLGVSTAVAAPLGDDVAGELVRDALAEDGVDVVATRWAPRTPTTVVLPFGSDRAMVTVDPGVRAFADDVASQSPRAVATNLDLLHLVPEGAMAYVTCGDDEARAFREHPPAALRGARALFVTRSEMLTLTGESAVEPAAAALAELAENVVVWLAEDGGLIATGGDIHTAPAESVGPSVDSTGTGDLLAAAYVWADLRGADTIDRLRWAILYASLGMTRPTGIGGAQTEAELLAAGTARGLRPPPLVGAARG
jgi:sugar/nucleoside kinase (ribokinase family)